MVAERSTAISEPEEPRADAVRVLVPSPIGVLGLEFEGPLVTEVAIVPVGRHRASFTPFADLEGSEALDEILGRLSEYFAGARRDLDLQYDLGRYEDLDGFARRVLRQTAKIRYGDTKTYQQIATAAGRPGGYRNVLAVLQTNPLPIVIPCHRVVTAKSGAGSYVAAPSKKEWLLDLERKALESGRV